MIWSILWSINIIISLACLIASGCIMIIVKNETALFLLKLPKIEVFIQAMFVLLFSCIPLLNIWYLGYLIYHRHTIVKNQTTWVFILDEYENNHYEE